MQTTGRRRRRWPWAVAVATIGLLAFVLVWFQPHKLFIDERVDEAIPVVAADAGSSTTGASSAATDAGTEATATTRPPEPAEPVELARGEFVSRDHTTSGVARVLELADGSRILRLEGLDTDNGPDLYVYLTTTPADGDEGAFDDEHLDLGRLKGNQGDQNYDVPAGADLGRFSTVVIWCERFSSAFGAADLLPA